MADAIYESIIPGLRGWETRGEQLALAHLAHQVMDETSIVEIGSEFGMSTGILAKASKPRVSVTAIDPFPDDTFHIHASSMEKIGVKHKIIYYNMISELAAPLYIQNDGRPIDILFIDGDHSTAAVLKDIMHWIPLLVVGGVVAFHDTMAYTNQRPHEQHEWVQTAIEQWLAGYFEIHEYATWRSLHPPKFVETVPVDSMRMFVRIKE